LFADGKNYEWVPKQYSDAGEEAEIIELANGQIDGEEYIALLSRISADHNETMFVFKKTRNRHTLIAKIKNFYTIQNRVDIKNNSIYLESGTVYHGTYDTRYQFRRIGNKFKMIGAEYQAQHLLCDSGEESCHYDGSVWSGDSYNFLTSSAICWQELIFDLGGQKYAEVNDRYQKWLPSKNAVSHQMKFRPIKLPLLDGFDLDLDFELPATCYFDNRNKLKFMRRR
jgi:hypothetical protein